RELANRLRVLGVGPETVVAICVERSPEAALAALAVLEAGGAYLPLDPAYPAERLRFMLEDSGAAAVLVRPDLRRALPETAVPVLDVNFQAGDGDRPGETGDPDDPDRLAYVIYTSGSTGRPKGVEIPHRGLSNLIAWHRRIYGVTPEDRATLLAGPAFDASVWELWPYLAAGASVRVPDAETRSDPARLLAWMAAEGITLAFLPTPLAEALVEIAERGVPPGLKLRALLTGGDRLRRAPGRDLPFLLVNHYGPTEVSVVTTAGVVPAGRSRTLSGAPPIGHPIAGVRVHLLDSSLRRVPQGVPGELCIGGAGLARGYRGRPELTAEKLIPDSQGAAPGTRLYRTGDLARWLPDGGLEFLGRLDHQVKVRGFRIELGEVEAVLGEHAGVREAVVVARGEGEERGLVAYVVAEDAVDLRSWLGERLPAYMVPAAFVSLSALPLTPNGKVDLRARPEPEWGEGAGDKGNAAPPTPLEELLAGIWSAVLGVGEVGTRDNFFKLGGHSLLATRVLSRVRDSVGAEVPLAALFEAPTVAGLARSIEEILRGPAEMGADAPIPRRAAEGEPVPLSFAQERLWFLDQLTPGISAYNIARAFALEGPLDTAALERAVGEILRRHQALRTTFAAADGRPIQVVSPAPEVRLPRMDLSGCPGPLREAEAERLLREEARRPFDLERGPLLRLTLLRLGPGEHRLALTMHHIVSDGWSTALFLRELAVLYRRFATGDPAALPDLPVQYADFALWQRARLEGERLEALIAHWKAELAGAPALLELPTDRPRPMVQSYRGAQVELDLPPDLAAGLRDLARRSGATLFMALLAAFGALFARFTGRRDVVLGSPVAGRNRSEIEDLIGFFVNNLVLRLRWEGDPGFSQLLDRARRVTLAAHTHQDLPFERLVAELAPARSLGQTPLFQVVLALQNGAADTLEMPDLELTPLPVARGESRFDLELGVVEGGTGEGMRLLWRYDRDLFDGATVARLAGCFRQLLGGLVADPGRRLSELPLLTPAEREQLLAWGATGAVFPRDQCLHELFAAQAARTPDAVALTFAGAGLTYRELAERTNRLARYLAGLGVRPGDLVGLCLERSLDMVVALLGVLEAGAAYLPLDPAYPRERLAFALEDSRVEVLITLEELTSVLPPTSARVVRLDAERQAIGRERDEPLALPVAPDFPAYVIYTSGSTGRPKGVVVTHANVVRLFAATESWYGFGPDDIWTLFHSYAFDFSVWELWGALLYGGRLAVVPYWLSRSPEAFYELLRAERVTVLNQTPSAFRQLLWAEGERKEPSSLALRGVIFGGEALELASLSPWFERHGDERPRLVDMYGITETTVHVTFRQISRRDLAGSRGSVLGIPIPDLSLRVLDPDLHPQPIGVAGEICVGGAGLALGYLGRPELTAERFVPDPFGGPGARLYRSGDLARYLPDGGLEYLGRIDHQVKIRGFRIELGEIETALASQPEVREAVVLAREDVPGDKRLVAYLVVERELATGELRERLQAVLPESMIPAAFVTLPALPLTANGKVDRRALPTPEAGRSELGTTYAPPEAPEEKWLAEVWAEVLDVERVGIHDDFFHLGGHSLLAARVIARLRRQFQVDLPLRSLFQTPTIAGLLRAVQEVREHGGAARAPRISAVPRTAHRRLRPREGSTP
ncbi:MAG TPA: amino acid adenylation domain-containing protein, partial [Thermoanaerobaculia bacterium]|nr:amino acid adenylation domain-containing protein [Thermoanaerobaculia bacterium]